jgi:hypothetical protein
MLLHLHRAVAPPGGAAVAPTGRNSYYRAVASAIGFMQPGKPPIRGCAAPEGTRRRCRQALAPMLKEIDKVRPPAQSLAPRADNKMNNNRFPCPLAGELKSSPRVIRKVCGPTSRPALAHVNAVAAGTAEISRPAG